MAETRIVWGGRIDPARPRARASRPANDMPLFGADPGPVAAPPLAPEPAPIVEPSTDLGSQCATLAARLARLPMNNPERPELRARLKLLRTRQLAAELGRT